jgi:fatty-acyl-CoA synthase
VTTYNLADLFEGVVDAVAERPALVGRSGRDDPGIRWTFAELDGRANQAARLFEQLGVRPGDHVGLGTRNGTEFVECLLGLYKLGALPVNVNYRYGAEELRFLAAEADLVAALVEPDLVPVLEGLRSDLPGLGPVLAPGPDYEAHLAALPADRADPGPRSSDDLYLLFTGGTTGMPKGVMWRHEDIVFASLGGAGSPRFGITRLDDPDRIGDWARTGSLLSPRMPLCPLMHGSRRC